MTSPTAYDGATAAGSGPHGSAADLAGYAYTRSGRVATALLRALAAGSLPVLLLMVVLATDPPITPPVLWRLLLPFTVLPGLAGWLVRRAHAAHISVRDGVLLVERPGVRLELACDTLAGVRPWRLPLPGPGLSLIPPSTTGARFGLEPDDPAPLLAALAHARVPGARDAAGRTLMVYARARASRQRNDVRHLLARYPLFAMVPAAVLFHLHQHIAYGGTFGEWYALGGASYLRTAAIYWATTTAYLAMYASVWRGIAEGLCLAAAFAAPARATAMRRVTEIAFRVLYYGGVPTLLALRLLA